MILTRRRAFSRWRRRRKLSRKLSLAERAIDYAFELSASMLIDRRRVALEAAA